MTAPWCIRRQLSSAVRRTRNEGKSTATDLLVKTNRDKKKEVDWQVKQRLSGRILFLAQNLMGHFEVGIVPS